MRTVDTVQSGVHLLDKLRSGDRVVRVVERLGRVVKTWCGDHRTGGMDPFFHSVEDAAQRSDRTRGGPEEFQPRCERVRLVAECDSRGVGHRGAGGLMRHPRYRVGGRA